MKFIESFHVVTKVLTPIAFFVCAITGSIAVAGLMTVVVVGDLVLNLFEEKK